MTAKRSVATSQNHLYGDVASHPESSTTLLGKHQNSITNVITRLMQADKILTRNLRSLRNKKTVSSNQLRATFHKTDYFKPVLIDACTISLVGRPDCDCEQKRLFRASVSPLNACRSADKSLARPTSRRILFDGENISFDASLVICINSTNIPPIMFINRIYEYQNLLSLQLVSFLFGLRTYQHPCIKQFCPSASLLQTKQL